MTLTSSYFTFGFYLKNLLGKFCKFLNIRNNYLELTVTSVKEANFVLTILKKDPMCSYNMLLEISAVDYIKEKHDIRFQIGYFLFSYKYNMRLKVILNVSGLTNIPSVTTLYPNANWLERQIWDMFGLHFENHPDLRRILTDYGFEGFPLRKDFPLLGYFEVYYDDELKRVSYKPVKMTQGFRDFNFNMPWKWTEL